MAGSAQNISEILGDKHVARGPESTGELENCHYICREAYDPKLNTPGNAIDRLALTPTSLNAETNQMLAGCQIIGGDSKGVSIDKNRFPMESDLLVFSLSDLERTSKKTADTVSAVLKQKPHGDTIDKHKVERDMVPSLGDSIRFLRTRDPGNKHYDGYLTAQTSMPPGNQNCYAANVTRPYEERTMKLLVQLAAEHKHISQKELVSIVSKMTPDQETAVLTLANLTKNLAALSRGRDEPDKGDGTTRSGVKFLKNRGYTADDATKVVDLLQPISSGGDKMGCMYHFYGAMAATYFLGRPGKAMVELEARTHPDPQKQAANRAGEAAAQKLRVAG